MQLYKLELGWTDGLCALIFHGQYAEVANIFNLTNIFQVSPHYQNTRFAESKLVLGYVLGVSLRYLAGYSEGHYLLTAKGAIRQQAILRLRGLTPEEVWVLDPQDPRSGGRGN